MSHHHVYSPNLPGLGPLPGPVFAVGGDEAHHLVRVRRAREGDQVRLFDGQGRCVIAIIESIRRDRQGWVANVRPESVEELARPTPRIWVYAPAPKGDRLGTMVEQLSQVGAAGWSPLRSERAIVEPRAGGAKLAGLARVAIESMKQCGRSWAMEIGEPVTVSESLAAERDRGSAIVVADATGRGRVPTVDSIAMFIGPEGGWTPGELGDFQAAAASVVPLGPYVLRLETAAVVAAAMCIVARPGGV